MKKIGIKANIFFLLLAMGLLSFASSSEAQNCECGFFENSLKESQKRFDSLINSGEKDRESLFLECIDRKSLPDPLINYCKKLTATSNKTEMKKAHEKEIGRFKKQLKGCMDSGAKCAAWKIELSKDCDKLEGDNRGNCYIERGMAKEYKRQYPSEAKDFLKASKEKRRKIDDFLYAKVKVCDRKYKDDISRMNRCVSNFRKKYGIQPILKFLSDKKEGKQPQRTGKKAKQEPDTDRENAASFILGKWHCPGFLFEITNDMGPHSIKCLMGCGSGDKYEWLPNFNFRRTYSKSNKLVSGVFEELCVFDNATNEYRCDGEVKQKTIYGQVDKRKLETKVCEKLLD